MRSKRLVVVSGLMSIIVGGGVLLVGVHGAALWMATFTLVFGVGTLFMAAVTNQ